MDNCLGRSDPREGLVQEFKLLQIGPCVLELSNIHLKHSSIELNRVVSLIG